MRDEVKPSFYIMLAMSLAMLMLSAYQHNIIGYIGWSLCVVLLAGLRRLADLMDETDPKRYAIEGK